MASSLIDGVRMTGSLAARGSETSFAGSRSGTVPAWGPAAAGTGSAATAASEAAVGASEAGGDVSVGAVSAGASEAGGRTVGAVSAGASEAGGDVSVGAVSAGCGGVSTTGASASRGGGVSTTGTSSVGVRSSRVPERPWSSWGGIEGGSEIRLFTGSREVGPCGSDARAVSWSKGANSGDREDSLSLRLIRIKRGLRVAAARRLSWRVGGPRSRVECVSRGTQLDAWPGNCCPEIVSRGTGHPGSQGVLEPWAFRTAVSSRELRCGGGSDRDRGPPGAGPGIRTPGGPVPRARDPGVAELRRATWPSPRSG